MRRAATLLTLTAGLLLLAVPAFACGFLVAPNGAVRLVRTATLVGHVDGVEHYVTSFEFQGGGAAFGSIVPLPAEPHTVEKAGSWTLQRLQREFRPPVVAEAAPLAAAGDGATVLREVEIDALDITILEGGGDEVVAWAEENGFDLGEGVGDLLGFYADRSPYFMAARFDPQRAERLDQSVGDGTPIHLAMPTEDPWVPLRILGFDKPAGEVVEADVFLLTEREPTLLPTGRRGPAVEASRPAGSALLDDLRSDENSGWVPERAWLTYLRLREPAGSLTYDLAVDVDGGEPSRTAAFGSAAVQPVVEAAPPTPAAPSAPGPALPLLLAVGALVVSGGLLRLAVRTGPS